MSINQIPNHSHNGLNSSQIDPKDLLGFSIVSSTAQLSTSAPNGTMRLYFDGTNYRVYYRINNLWKYATLT